MSVKNKDTKTSGMQKIGCGNSIIDITPQEYESIIMEIESKINNGDFISSLEFLIINNDLKLKYINEVLNNYISGDETLSPLCLKLCNSEIKKAYIQACSKEDVEFGDDYFGNLDKETQEFYLEALIEKGDADLSQFQFNLLDEKYKVKYIFYYGIHNLPDFAKKWWDIAKKAKYRDLQIESIFN